VCAQRALVRLAWWRPSAAFSGQIASGSLAAGDLRVYAAQTRAGNARRHRNVFAADPDRSGAGMHYQECAMSDHAYKLVEVIESRGHVVDSKVAHLRVTVKVGFRIEA
jgi:Dodecin